MAVNAWVFSGGEFRPADLHRHELASSDLIVGVDHGIAHCLQAGHIPDVLIGDFDSVENDVLNDARLVGVPTVRHPIRKDRSDLELALDWLRDKSVSCVTLLGVSGGRTDHHLFNWLLPLQGVWDFDIKLIDASVHAHVVSVRHPLQAPVHIGQTVSILALPEADGVNTQGLEYALDGASIQAGSTLGLSNVAVSGIIGVSVLSGRLLVFIVKSDNILGTT